MKTVEICVSYSSKVSCGKQYENKDIFNSFKETIENCDLTDEQINERHRELLAERRLICEEEKQTILRSDKNEKLDYYEKNGAKYVRVTSILSLLYPISFPEYALSFYADLGTIHHKTAEVYFESGETLTPKQAAPELYERLKTTSFQLNGKTMFLDPDSIDFHKYWNEYGMEWNVTECEKTIYNSSQMYAGTLDIKGKDFIGDFKTSKKIDKEKADRYFKQMAFYSMCDGVNDIKKLVIFPLAGGAPIVTTDVEQYQTMALADLKAFLQKIK